MNWKWARKIGKGQKEIYKALKFLKNNIKQNGPKLLKMNGKAKKLFNFNKKKKEKSENSIILGLLSFRLLDPITKIHLIRIRP